MQLLPNTKLMVIHFCAFGATGTYFCVLGGVFWGFDLDSSFHLVTELCQDTILLGKLLLDLSKVMNETAVDNNKKSKSVGYLNNN